VLKVGVQQTEYPQARQYFSRFHRCGRTLET
jgi:hypothetical protein